MLDEEGLVLLHLSDIHFGVQSNAGPYDLDADLRAELLRDAADVAAERQVDAVVVTGDIAFSGKREEYEIAGNWLETLCDEVGCANENVWVVPGNHDVDRSVIDASPLLRDVHEKLRAAQPNDLDARIRDYCVTDVEAARLLYSPLENYNEFAARFECDIDASRPYWEADLALRDGSTLRLRGLNSTLASDSLDDRGANRMVLGTAQVLMPVKDGVERLSLCHHPPSWLLDQDESERWLTNRARIQLYGHKHEFGTDRINNSIRLVAGAVHPSRREQNWDPRYNFVVVDVEGADEDRSMAVHVHPRVWHKEYQRFGPHPDLAGASSRRHDLPLSQWASQPNHSSREGAPGTDANLQEIGSPTEERAVNPERRLVYQFLSLPYPTRLSIAHRLQLIEDEDESLRGRELDRRVLERAKLAGRLEDLRTEITQSSQPSPASDGPDDS